MTATTIRSATLDQILTLVRSDSRLGDAKVLDAGDGGDGVNLDAAEVIGFGEITGTTVWRNMRAGRKEGEDTFSIAWIIWSTTTGRRASVARDRCETLWMILYDAVANSPNLSGAVSGLRDLTFPEVNGPDAWPDGEGWGAVMTGTIRGTSTIS